MKSRELKFEEFYHEPCHYAVYSREDAKTLLSCVIVEDEPGPYLEFLCEIVEAGLCRKAMTVPFSDKTLALLGGEEVCFGSDSGSTEVVIKIPDISQCVAVVDMRNTSTQSFKSYESNRSEVAGYQLRKQLRGFLGTGFYATRYGRVHLDEMGVTRDWGVALLEMKAGTMGKMPENDREILKEVLTLQFTSRDLSNANLIADRGASVAITFQGVCSIGRKNRGPQFFLALIQDHLNGGSGLDSSDLCRLLGVRHIGERVKTLPERITLEERQHYAQLYREHKKTVSQLQGKVEDLRSQIAEVKAKTITRIATLRAQYQSELDRVFSSGLSVEDLLNVAADCPQDICDEEGQIAYRSLAAKAQKAFGEFASVIAALEQQLDSEINNLQGAKSVKSDAFRLGIKSQRDGSTFVVPQRTPDDKDNTRHMKTRLLTDLQKWKPKPDDLIRHLTDAIDCIGGKWTYTGGLDWKIPAASKG